MRASPSVRLSAGDDLSRLLNPLALGREESDVNIQYRFEKGKRVRVISAPKEALQRRGRKPKEEPRPPLSHRGSVSPHEHHHDVVDQKEHEEILRRKKTEAKLRKGPVKPGSRPMWGYKNPNLKKVQKQSEKDPYYAQRKRQSDLRRQKREEKLLALVEANKDIIPRYYVPETQRAAVSRSRSRSQSPYSDIEMASPRQVKLGRRARSHSPDTFRQQGDANQHNSHHHHHHHHGASDNRRRRESPSPHERRHRHESPHNDYEHEDASRHHQWNHSKSPPVPAIRHRNDPNTDPGQTSSRKGGKYNDGDPLDIPVQNGEFVPFTRTVDILDPAKAEEPLPLSREATKVANARRKYYESLHPQQFGNKQYPLKDEHRPLPVSNQKVEPTKEYFHSLFIHISLIL